MKKLLAIIFLFLTLSVSYSQNIPVLNVDNKPIGLSSLDIKVEVIGNIATTTYDMLFYNPTNTILEGELSFPLGDGHNVSRFALDINGKLREAVIVNKELGRIAFEQIVREGVDPALLEKGTGNNYKARIYPIPANGYKRVLLAYEQELTLNEGAHYYGLPLNFNTTLDTFSLDITVFNQDREPVIEKGNISGLDFTNWKENYNTKVSKKNFKPKNSLLIKIPVSIESEKTSIYQDYFHIYKALPKKQKLRIKPKQITLYWDASFSMQDRDLKKEFAFLNNYLGYLDAVELTFISFSNTIITTKIFNIKNGKWDDLKEEMEATIYDGGTNYDIVFNNIIVKDATLLFSDGIVTLNETNYKTNTPIFIVNSLDKSNYTLLNTITESSNGAYINLNTSTTTEALNLVKNEAYKFLGYTSNSETLEVYPKGPITVVNDFSISGKNFSNKDIVVLNFGYHDKIDQKITIDLSKATLENKNSKRYWAQKKLKTLEVNSKKNKNTITELGLDYNLVTDYTSLIVLDNVRDYIRYKITPPEELLEEYNTALAEIEAENKSNLQNAVSLSRNSDSQEPLRINSGIINTNDALAIPEDEMLEEMVIEETISYRSPRYMDANDAPITSQTSPPAAPEQRSNDELNEEVIESESNGFMTSRVSQRRVLDSTLITRKKKALDIAIKDRTVATDYIKALRKSKNKHKAYALYITQRKEYKDTPAYFIDVSNLFIQEFKDPNYAARILSNIPEVDFDNYELLKVFGYQLQYNDQHDLAVFIFKRILELRPEDSQSYRDLAIAYEKVGLCQEALDLYTSIITGSLYENNKRRVFNSMKTISENEVKHLISEYKNDLNLKDTDKKLQDEANFDLRIVVDWNHNDTDIDLHIIDPNLEECFYSHPNTKIGGHMSEDMTQGFGPEEFTLANAKKGDYYIKVKYYGDRYQKIENPTFMKVSIFKYYGTKRQTFETKIIRLVKTDDVEVIAKLSF